MKGLKVERPIHLHIKTGEHSFSGSLCPSLSEAFRRLEKEQEVEDVSVTLWNEIGECAGFLVFHKIADSFFVTGYSDTVSTPIGIPTPLEPV